MEKEKRCRGTKPNARVTFGDYDVKKREKKKGKNCNESSASRIMRRWKASTVKDLVTRDTRAPNDGKFRGKGAVPPSVPLTPLCIQTNLFAGSRRDNPKCETPESRIAGQIRLQFFNAIKNNYRTRKSRVRRRGCYFVNETSRVIERVIKRKISHRAGQETRGEGKQ